jgi:insertion element IS1 protein InsB
MQCQYCSNNCQKAGRQKNGAQKLYCVACRKYQQKIYRNKAYEGRTNRMISALVCEGVGIRGIGRILKMATNTVLGRIKTIATGIEKPFIPPDQPGFEVDELWTYIGHKANEYWLAYALDKTAGQVADFVIGKRTKATLKTLIDNLLASGVRKIYTDRLTHYQRLSDTPMRSLLRQSYRA